MYAILQTVHSFWAYFVLLLLLVATGNALLGRAQNKDFATRDLRISLFGLIFSHIQLLIGIILYFVSPWFQQWSQGIGAVMKDPTSRLYLVEHPTTNILAIILITMGWSMHKRQNQDVKKFSRIGIFYGLGLILLLSRIPWQSWLG